MVNSDCSNVIGNIKRARRHAITAVKSNSRHKEDWLSQLPYVWAKAGSALRAGGFVDGHDV